MRPLPNIITSGALIGLAFAFAREATGTFIGAMALGLVVGGAALQGRAR